MVKLQVNASKCIVLGCHTEGWIDEGDMTEGISVFD
jgi:hypothetical protein